jgi:hypothetical protein
VNTYFYISANNDLYVSGENFKGQLDIGSNKLSAGFRHSLYIDNKGNLYGTGENLKGELGNSNTQFTFKKIF